MKKFASIVKAALCSTLGILIMASCTNYNEMLDDDLQGTSETAENAVAENSVEAEFEDGDEDENQGSSAGSLSLEDALNNGTFHVEFEAEGIKFSGDCYVNEDDGTSSQMYTFTGNKGTTAKIYAFTDQKTMKFGTIGKSGTHIYSIDMDTLADKLKDSIFGPDSDSYYSLSQEEYDMLLEYAAEINSAISGESLSSNADTYAPYVETIVSFILKNPPETSKKTEVTINGETVLADIVEYDFSREALRELAEQLLDKALEQEDLAEEYGYSQEDLKEAKSELMAELDELEDYSFNFVYYTNSETGELMEIDAKIKWAEPQNPESDYDDEYAYWGAMLNRNAAYVISVSAVYGADPAASEKQKIQIDYFVDYYDNTYLDDSTGNILAEITKTENKTAAVITITADGETITLAAFTAEKNGDDYSVTLEIPELDITAGMTGTIVQDKDSFTMTIDKLFANSGSTEMAYLPKAVVSIETGGELLDLDAEKEFLDITEEELDALLENIEADFEAVFSEFADDSSLGRYVNKSKLTAANAKSKLAYTAISTQMIKMEIDGETIKSDTVTGVGSIVTIDGKEFDLTDYLGESSGYIYAEINPDNCAVNFVVWSEEPIPEKYKHQLSDEEQQKLMGDGIFIGCYPYTYAT